MTEPNAEQCGDARHERLKRRMLRLRDEKDAMQEMFDRNPAQYRRARDAAAEEFDAAATVLLAYDKLAQPARSEPTPLGPRDESSAKQKISWWGSGSDLATDVIFVLNERELDRFCDEFARKSFEKFGKRYVLADEALGLQGESREKLTAALATVDSDTSRRMMQTTDRLELGRLLREVLSAEPLPVAPPVTSEADDDESDDGIRNQLANMEHGLIGLRNRLGLTPGWPTTRAAFDEVYAALEALRSASPQSEPGPTANELLCLHCTNVVVPNDCPEWQHADCGGLVVSVHKHAVTAIKGKLERIASLEAQLAASPAHALKGLAERVLAVTEKPAQTEQLRAAIQRLSRGLGCNEQDERTIDAGLARIASLEAELAECDKRITYHSGRSAELDAELTLTRKLHGETMAQLTALEQRLSEQKLLTEIANEEHEVQKKRADALEQRSAAERGELEAWRALRADGEIFATLAARTAETADMRNAASRYLASLPKPPEAAPVEPAGPAEPVEPAKFSDEQERAWQGALSHLRASGVDPVEFLEQGARAMSMPAQTEREMVASFANFPADDTDEAVEQAAAPEQPAPWAPKVGDVVMRIGEYAMMGVAKITRDALQSGMVVGYELDDQPRVWWRAEELRLVEAAAPEQLAPWEPKEGERVFIGVGVDAIGERTGKITKLNFSRVYSRRGPLVTAYMVEVDGREYMLAEDELHQVEPSRRPACKACESCGGSGKRLDDVTWMPCKACDGKGHFVVAEPVEAAAPKGEAMSEAMIASAMQPPCEFSPHGPGRKCFESRALCGAAQQNLPPMCGPCSRVWLALAPQATTQGVDVPRALELARELAGEVETVEARGRPLQNSTVRKMVSAVIEALGGARS